MTSKMNPDESRMFEQVKELCTLCAKGIVQISDDTHFPPTLVAKMFVETFQHILKMMEEDKDND